MDKLIIYKHGTSASKENIRCEIVKWNYSDTYMGETTVSFDYESPVPIPFAIGDWCGFRGELFILNYKPTCTQQGHPGDTGNSFVYQGIKMNSTADDLTRCEFLDVVHTSGMHVASEGTNYTGSGTFSLYCHNVQVKYHGETKFFCPAHVLLDKIHANLLRLYGTTDGQPYNGNNAKWNIYIDDSKCLTDSVVVNAQNWSCAQALSELHSLFVFNDGSNKHIEYIVRGYNIIVGDVSSLISQYPHLAGITGYLTDINNDGVIYNYGYGRGFNTPNDDGKGLFKLIRTSNSEQQVITRLRAYGSTKNLPYMYYNKRYSLPQTMFVQNLQLPQTFLPYTGDAPVRPDSEPYRNKTEANEARDEQQLGTRQVKGESNDAYIDKNDDAEHCDEGIREASARWDGSDGELPEIYPTISDGTYKDLRAGAVKDMQGNISGTNHFKNYGNNERIDTILAPGESCNIGDGRLSDKDITKKTLDTIPVNILGPNSCTWDPSAAGAQRWMETQEAEILISEKHWKGRIVLGYTTEMPALYVSCTDIGSGDTRGFPYKVLLSLKIIGVPIDGSAESEISRYSCYIEPKNGVEAMPALPDFGKDMVSDDRDNYAIAFNETQAIGWSTETLNLEKPSRVKICVSLKYKRSVATNNNQFSFVWGIYPKEGYSSGIIPKCQIDYSSAELDYESEFTMFVKDNGINWLNLDKSEDGDVQITMNTGNCGGRTFKVLTEETKRTTRIGEGGSMVDCWELRLEKATDDSIYAYFPSEVNPISAGDEYVITNIVLPDAYIRMAEARLLIAATAYLLDNQETKFTYQPKLDEIYLRRDYDRNIEAGTPEKSIFWRLHAGLKFTFRLIPEEDGDDDYTLGDITIEQVQISMDGSDVPKVDIKLNDELSESTQEKIKTSVDRIYGILMGGGSGTSASMPALLQFMRTEGSKLFLRKDIDDIASGNYEFKQNIDIDGKTTMKDDVSVLTDIAVRGTARTANVDAERVRADGIYSDYMAGDKGGDITVDADVDVTDNLNVEGQSRFDGKTHHNAGLEVNYTPDYVTGTGAQIDGEGNAVVKSLTARDFFAAPEFRFNRISVTDGETWTTNGLGLIESVEVMGDLWGRIRLKLEENEYGSVAVGDICRGLFNELAGDGEDGVAREGVDDLSDDGNFDGCGFRMRYGFFTSYFWITEIETNSEGECVFLYELKDAGTPHPCKFMKFAQYGSFTNTQRQSSAYECTRPGWYRVIYHGVCQWQVQAENISQIQGTLTGFKLKLKNGNYLTFGDGERGIYIDKNIYFGETLQQIDPATVEDLQEQLALYHVDQDSQSDNVTVDSVGNVIGGLRTVTTYEEGGVTKRAVNYRLHTSLSVTRGEKRLLLSDAATMATSPEGKYSISAFSTDCDIYIRKSTVYVTAIHNVKDGVAGTYDDVDFDYDSMRAMKECHVTITVNCEGAAQFVRTYNINIDHVETPYIGADMVNEQASVRWDAHNATMVGVPYEFSVNARHGNESLKLSGLSIGAMTGLDYKLAFKTAPAWGGQTIAEIEQIIDDDIESRSTTEYLVTKAQHELFVSEGVIVEYTGVVVVTALPRIAGVTRELPVTLSVNYAGVDYERTLTHRVRFAGDEYLYELRPSVDKICLGDGTSTVSALACDVLCTPLDGSESFYMTQNDIDDLGDTGAAMYAKKRTLAGAETIIFYEVGDSISASELVNLLDVTFYFVRDPDLIQGEISGDILDTECVPVIRDGESTPEYHIQRYIWASDETTASPTTAPSHTSGSWTAYISSRPTGYDYLWMRDQYYVLNGGSYTLSSTTYVRQNGKDGENGTGIEFTGTIPSTETTESAQGTWLGANVSSPFTGMCYISEYDGYLWVYASQWRRTTQVRGADGTSQYLHVAWCDKVYGGTDWSGHADSGFTTTKASGVDYKYMGVLVNTTSGSDPDITHAGEYAWNEIKGEQGDAGDDGVVFTLMPSLDVVSFVSLDGETYTPASQALHCDYIKAVGGVITPYDGTDRDNLSGRTTIDGETFGTAEYNMFYRWGTGSYAWMRDHNDSHHTGDKNTIELSVPSSTGISTIEFVLSSANTYSLVDSSNIVARATVGVVKSGLDGSDGTYWEYIYKLTATDGRPATPTTSSQLDGVVPAGWTGDPTGVSSTYMYEWVSVRRKTGGTWGAFSTPSLWSKWGEQGEKGDDAVAYSLAPTATSLKFGYSGGAYTPASQEIGFGYEKVEGDTREVVTGNFRKQDGAPYNMLWHIKMNDGTRLPTSGWWWMYDPRTSQSTRGCVELDGGVMTVYGNSDLASIEVILTSATSSSGVTDQNTVARVSVPVTRDGVKGDTGLTGQMVRMRGVWMPRTSYYNDAQYKDVVLKWDSANERYDYYECAVTDTGASDATFPTGKFTLMNWLDNVATSLLVANRGFVQILGTGEMFVGQTEDGDGWEITRGRIRHTGSGLTLTADGDLEMGGGNLTLSADRILANGLRIDASGNLVMSGAVNNGELVVTGDNVGDYILGGTKSYIDVLRCPPTVIFGDGLTASNLPNEIWLPCAYLPNEPNATTAKEGYTKLDVFHQGEQGTWFGMNLSDLRSLIGRKIRFYKTQSVNPEIALYCQILTRRGDDYDGAVTSYHIDTEREVLAYPGLSAASVTGVGMAEGGMVELECKRGVWHDWECIYWEATDTAYMLE